jgi:hypothetical protein
MGGEICWGAGLKRGVLLYIAIRAMGIWSRNKIVRGRHGLELVVALHPRQHRQQHQELLDGRELLLKRQYWMFNPIHREPRVYDLVGDMLAVRIHNNCTLRPRRTAGNYGRGKDTIGSFQNREAFS